MQGKIIKGIGGFYYVYVEDAGIYECRARGLFRKNDVKPLVGDLAVIESVEDSEEGKLSGNIKEVLPRKNSLPRPEVANVDQVLVVFAAASPKPDPNLIDRLLISAGYCGIPSVLCFNKCELIDAAKRDFLSDVYAGAGCGIRFVSTYTGEGMEELKRTLASRTTALAGPSGVGKSSLINLISETASMETGILSRKTDRGRHTTRHSELFPVPEGGFVFDTPGFSSVYLPEMEKEDLASYYPEFDPYKDRCRFGGCSHISEPGCAVKDALGRGLISPARYENYKLFYEELKNRRKY